MICIESVWSCIDEIDPKVPCGPGYAQDHPVEETSASPTRKSLSVEPVASVVDLENSGSELAQA